MNLHPKTIRISGGFLLCVSLLIISFINPTLVQSAEESLEPSIEQKSLPKKYDVLETINKVLSSSKSLVEQLKNIPDERFGSESEKKNLERLTELNAQARNDFQALIDYLAKSPEDIDEAAVKDLTRSLKESLRRFLNELHYVLDDSLARVVSESLDDLKPRHLTLRELFNFQEDEILNTLFIINEDPLKFNDALLKFNDYLLAEEQLKIKAENQ